MSLFPRSAAWVRNLRGWRRAALAFAAGAFSALGFAPVEFSPALLLGFAILLLLLDGTDESPHPMRAGALAGWAFAFGQYLIGWHWIGYAFLVDPAAHLWQMPFALLILTSGLALWAGIACGLAVYFWQPLFIGKNRTARLLVFAILYAAGEWVRGHALTGFPWNLPAYGWGASLAVLQSTSVIGAYGLSFLTVLFGASLAELTTGRCKSACAMLLLFLALWGFGVWRLAQHPTRFVQNVQLRLVQPGVPQREKDNPVYYARNWQRLLDLSTRPGNPTHIIWPEAAPPPLLFDRSAYARDEVALLTAQNRVLIAGATHFQRGPDRVSFFNSLYIFAPGGALSAIYDKFHLVPFGEYVPFAPILNKIGITKLTAGDVGFDSGDGPHTYKVPGAPLMTPLICYEIIFPGAVTDHQQRPGWFVNVTDDSWFGPWAGPYQHLLIARVRAIEEAIPVARAASTGISAVIDPVGRLTASLGLGKMGVVDARLPAALAPSLYSRLDDVVFLLMLVGAAAMAWIIGRK
jgi:apolipoprotein N-acyltransferase